MMQRNRTAQHSIDKMTNKYTEITSTWTEDRQWCPFKAHNFPARKEQQRRPMLMWPGSELKTPPSIERQQDG